MEYPGESSDRSSNTRNLPCHKRQHHLIAEAIRRQKIRDTELGRKSRSLPSSPEKTPTAVDGEMSESDYSENPLINVESYVLPGSSSNENREGEEEIPRVEICKPEKELSLPSPPPISPQETTPLTYVSLQLNTQNPYSRNCEVSAV